MDTHFNHTEPVNASAETLIDATETSFSVAFWDVLLERYIGGAREALGADADAVWAEGRALAFEDAVQLALAPWDIAARYGTPTVTGSLSTPATMLLTHPPGASSEAPQARYTGHAYARNPEVRRIGTFAE